MLRMRRDQNKKQKHTQPAGESEREITAGSRPPAQRRLAAARTARPVRRPSSTPPQRLRRYAATTAVTGRLGH